jgi:hypothetical protein
LRFAARGGCIQGEKDSGVVVDVVNAIIHGARCIDSLKNQIENQTNRQKENHVEKVVAPLFV